MAKFLNTSATNYFLEELIKTAQDRLILISPYLKLNDGKEELTEKAKQAGGESKKGRFGTYFLWDENLSV